MQNTHSLKAGDKVRCTTTYGKQFTEGKVYEVKDTTRYGLVSVTKDDSGSTTNGWDCKFFEEVEDTAKYRIRKSGGGFIVERRKVVESFHCISASLTEMEAKVICDALNAQVSA